MSAMLPHAVPQVSVRLKAIPPDAALQDSVRQHPGDTLVDPGVPRRPAGPSVAVLPFVNMSSDPENEYFSDGLAEELINVLSKVEGLRVASRTSAFAFKGKNEDVRRISEQLNVRTVLQGAFQHIDEDRNRVHVTGRLGAWLHRRDCGGNLGGEDHGPCLGPAPAYPAGPCQA